jgi:hypothetical protein
VPYLPYVPYVPYLGDAIDAAVARAEATVCQRGNGARGPLVQRARRKS